jgi:hypothetical protein
MKVIFWLLPWAVVTTAMLVLLVWRLLAAEQDTIRIAPGDPRVSEDAVVLTRKLARIDFWGKTCTAASVALLFLAGLAALYNTWMAGAVTH